MFNIKGVLLLIAFATCLTKPLPVFEFYGQDTAEDHFRFGFEYGKHFASVIFDRLNDSQTMHQMAAYQKTQEGYGMYQDFLKAHQKAFPLYMTELEGVARGSNISFEWLFLDMLEEEYSYLMPMKNRRRDGCSDYMLCNEDYCVDGHNEDNDFNNVGRIGILKVSFGKKNKFTAFSYLGQLPTGGFGFNMHGIAFTLNWMGPSFMRRGGLGRAFVSRNLLDAENILEAFQIINQPNQATGHNYQLMNFYQPHIYSIEFHPEQILSIRSIKNTQFFHANQYQTLNVDQFYGNSSVHRLARVKQMKLPTTPEEIEMVLGDQYDASYPIFHDEISHQKGELSDWTVTSVQFDLYKKKLFIFEGNPKNLNVSMTFDLLEWIGSKDIKFMK